MAVQIVEKKQVAELVNSATKQLLGETDILNEDLTNVVDIGTKLENANAYRNFLYNISLKISKTIFVERKYEVEIPSVLRDTFEYGQIVEKMRSELPEALDDSTWQLQDGASYDDNVFYGGKIETTLFFKSVVFVIPKSITEEQVKDSFTSATQLGRFVSMLFTTIQNALTVRLNSLIMMTINNFTAEVLNDGNTARAVNLLSEYKAISGNTTLTAEKSLYDKDFLRYATGRIKEYQGFIKKMSTLYSSGSIPVFTPKEKQHLILLEKFSNNIDTYLASDTFHDEFIKLPYHDLVTEWQGNGTTNAFNKISAINIKTSKGNIVSKSGIIGVLFDHDALGVTKDEPKVTSHEVKSASFTNYWFKEHLSYFNDMDENFIVFYVA